jgi:hypothetical protein
MTALIVIAVAGIAIFVLVPLFRQQRGPQDQSSSTAAFDDSSSSWSGSAMPVALGLAAGDSDHSSRSDGHRDQGDRAGESGWGEHGASGSWGEDGDASSHSDNGGSDSDGGEDGGSSND